MISVEGGGGSRVQGEEGSLGWDHAWANPSPSPDPNLGINVRCLLLVPYHTFVTPKLHPFPAWTSVSASGNSRARSVLDFPTYAP